jgi:hypothetical protein
VRVPRKRWTSAGVPRQTKDELDNDGISSAIQKVGQGNAKQPRGDKVMRRTFAGGWSERRRAKARVRA